MDIALPKRDNVAKLIVALKSQNWPTQAPAVRAVLELNGDEITRDQAFVLGRNIYQCACGDENTAKSVLYSLRSELARIDPEYASHLLNGMWFEVYFNHEGKFRGNRPKGDHLDKLLALQTVKKFEKSILFIRRELLLAAGVVGVVLLLMAATRQKVKAELAYLLNLQRQLEDNGRFDTLAR